MSEENQVVDEVVEAPEGTEEIQQESHEVSAVEQKALDMGWRPKSEFEGDEEDFIETYLLDLG